MKFSVLLPTRNRLTYLRYALESVIRQDYADWEVIVSDNDSEEDIAGYIRSLGDARIRYFRTDAFVPVTDNWNNALSLSTGQYIVMLGDDDCLMPRYFSSLLPLIRRYDEPDFLFTNGYQYAYPNVIPGFPSGYVFESPRYDVFGDGATPFLATEELARRVVDRSLRFTLPLSYNMQHSLVSRRFIDSLGDRGPFYQSPYPDYYATNAMFLVARRIVIVPWNCVAIGISPKSFGNFFFNDQEAKGIEFLNNVPSDTGTSVALRDIVLPGLTHNTSWLYSMQTLVQRFGDEYKIVVRYGRYRMHQIAYVCRQHRDRARGSVEMFSAMWGRLTLWEKVLVVVFYRMIELAWRWMPANVYGAVNGILNGFVFKQYPRIMIDRKDMGLKTILDVFERLPGIPEERADRPA